MSIERLSSAIARQTEARIEWRDETPEQTAELVVEEAGELLMAISNGMPAINVVSEIGDVLFLTLKLCNALEINPEAAVEMKIFRNSVKYPDALLSNGFGRDRANGLAKSLYEHMGGDKVFFEWYQQNLGAGDLTE